MSDRNKTDEENALEAFFEAARVKTPAPPDALMARIMTDADAAQPRAARAGWFQMFGGWAGVSGAVTAACVGVWIGVAPPQVLPDLGALALGYGTDEGIESAGFGWDIEIEIEEG